MVCACGRPFVPELEMYAAHRQTGEHHRWSERNWRAQDPEPVTRDMARRRALRCLLAPATMTLSGLAVSSADTIADGRRVASPNLAAVVIWKD